MTVAGRLAAFGAQICGVDTGSRIARVQQLTDGHTLFTHPVVSTAGPESYTTGTAIAADGTDVAWVAHSSSIVCHAQCTAVYAAAGATVHRLNIASAIVPGSLRLSGHDVRWQSASRRRSGRL